MKKEDYDALVLTGYDNVRYATDILVMQQVAEAYFEECAVIVDSNRDCYLISRLLEHHPQGEMPWIKQVPWIKEVIPGAPANIPGEVVPNIWSRLLSNKLIKLGAKRVGVELLFSQTFEKLKRLTPGVEYVPILNQLLEMRAIKNTDEVRLIEYSQSVADAAAQLGLELIRNGSGRTEKEIASKMAARMHEMGAEYVTHLLVMSGQLSGQLYPTSRALADGQTATFDIGCIGEGGYASDMARTGFVGRPDRNIMDAYEVLRDAYLTGLRCMKPGLKASELYAKVGRVLSESGYEGLRFSLGHGIGLRMMELPQIDKPQQMWKDMELKPGMVICMEPNVVVDRMLLEIESEVLMTDRGSKVLTQTPL